MISCFPRSVSEVIREGRLSSGSGVSEASDEERDEGDEAQDLSLVQSPREQRN